MFYNQAGFNLFIHLKYAGQFKQLMMSELGFVSALLRLLVSCKSNS